MPRLSLTTVAMFLLVAGAARAQDEVYERGKEKPHKAFIASEATKGVTLKDKAGTFIPAEKIDDVVYEVNPLKVRLAVYRPAIAAEKESLDPAKEKQRKTKLAEALKGYQEAATTITEAPAKRHAEYKVAVLVARQATEDGAPVAAAIDALKKFKSKHADSWQIGSALQLLGRLQLDAKDYEGARETFTELAQAPVPDEVKQEAQLHVIQVSLRANKAAEAQQLLDRWVKSLPKDSKHLGRAKVIQAELLLASNKADEAIKLLRGLTKETSDRDLKAAAYNTLGVSLFNKEEFKAALWEFLWVDVIYNQNKDEHAKALFYLAKTFQQLGELEKAQECREALLSDRAFASSEWRSRAQKELKAP